MEDGSTVGRAEAASTSLVILADRVGERARPQQQLREIDCGGGTSERGAAEEDFGNFLRTLRLPHKRRERGTREWTGEIWKGGSKRGFRQGRGKGEGTIRFRKHLKETESYTNGS